MKINDVITEATLGSYKNKASMSRGQAQMGAVFARDPAEREKQNAIVKKRTAGIERADARIEKARKTDVANRLAADVAKLPELKAEYAKMQARYKSLGGSNWQYADREQNLTPGEQEARSMEGAMNSLWRRISAAEKSQSVTEGPAFDKWANERVASQLHKLKKPHPKTWHDVDPKLGKQVDRMTQAEKVRKGLAHPDTLNTEQIYKVVALTKSNALAKPTKMKVKANSIEDLFSRLSANDWYPLEINGVEVIAGKRLKQGVAEASDISGLMTAAEMVRDYIITAEVDGVVKKFRVRGMTGPRAAQERFMRHAATAKVLGVKPVEQVVAVDNKEMDTDWHYKNIVNTTGLSDKARKDTTDIYNKLKKDKKQGVAEGNRFDEPLTGYHIVYKNSGNPVLNTPSFETKDQAQQYLMTKMFANHQDFKVVHTANVGVAEGTTPPGSPAWQDGYRAGIKDTTNKKPVGSYAYCDGWKAAKKHLSDKQKQQGVAEDWQKVNKSDKTDGMSSKAVKAYRRENPGSKLKTAVTKKPSELKAGSKDANRRKSFCARMSGMKKHNASAETKRDPDSPINKALRRWNCNESINEGKMSEVNYIVRALIDGEMDPYTVMNHPTSDTEKYVSHLLQHEYEEASREHRLHPDDDFEQILDIAVTNLGKDFGIL